MESESRRRSSTRSKDAAISWWDKVPERFRDGHVDVPVTPGREWKVRASATFDLGLRTVLATAVGTALIPRLVGDRLEAELGKLAFYRDILDGATRDAVLVAPGATQIDIRDTPRLTYRPPGIANVELSFDSPYRTLDPAIRDAWSLHEKSHRSVAQYWYHRGGSPRKTLIFLHGFFASAYWYNSSMFSLVDFWKRGYDIVLLALPFHGERSHDLNPFNGIGLMLHGFGHFNEALLQAVSDVRVIVDWLLASGAPSVGVSGLSLGGYVSATAAACESRLAFAIPNSCPVSIADLALEWPPVSWAVGSAMAWGGPSIVSMRKSLAAHCALTWHPKLPPERLMIIGGAGDRLAPPHHIALLHRHWPGSTLEWYPGSHIIHLHQDEYLKKMRRFMDACTG